MTEFCRCDVTKKCPRCKEVKFLFEFYKGQGYCIPCNKEKYKLWQIKHRKERILYQKEFFNKYPWYKTIRNIRSRLYHIDLPKNKCYKKYNIKNFLTPKDLEFLWFRDNASQMKRPSIDRINSTKDYTLENCHYIEISEHLKKEGFQKGSIPWITGKHFKMSDEQKKKLSIARFKYLEKKKLCKV